jgi:hypothetical protein
MIGVGKTTCCEREKNFNFREGGGDKYNFCTTIYTPVAKIMFFYPAHPKSLRCLLKLSSCGISSVCSDRHLTVSTIFKSDMLSDCESQLSCFGKFHYIETPPQPISPS